MTFLQKRGHGDTYVIPADAAPLGALFVIAAGNNEPDEMTVASPRVVDGR